METDDLGTYGRTITAATPEAQAWFDRGVNWTFGFHHEAAITCFRHALEADPGCAMAHWGIAYALGPNYNMPWHLYDPAGKAEALAGAYDAMQAAQAAAEGCTAPERALIDALSARYWAREPVDDMRPWDTAYAERMREVHGEFPDDLDILHVYVEAIMNRTPWRMWDLKSGGHFKHAWTGEAEAVMDRAFAERAEAWEHPGLLHLYVHLMEMSPYPERALRQADKLREIMPDAGHLVHMPTHIDVLCGDYQSVVHWNRKAIEADRKDYARSGGMNFYTLYRQHNYHFVIYGAMFLGQPSPALAAAEELIETTPEALMEVTSPPMADFLEGYIPMKQHVLVRFGMWEEILAQTLPENRELYCSTTAMMLYAKGVAHSALGNVAEAEATREAFLAAKDAVPETRQVHNNTVDDLLEIAAAMLDGELEYRKGNFEAAFAHLRRSVGLDDALPYDEPWGWMQPTRHALGALLLEQGRMEEAEAVYRADLGLDDTLSRACRHPENVWSLHGLHECLAARGETAERAHIRQRLDLALARAEVPVHASCYCRRRIA